MFLGNFQNPPKRPIEYLHLFIVQVIAKVLGDPTGAYVGHVLLSASRPSSLRTA
jgi:hypothetical protein